MNKNTDIYKLSMGEAGFPLRREMFYFAMRKGGPFYISFDLEREIRRIWLNHKYYPASDTNNERIGHPSLDAAVRDCHVTIKAVKPGNWVMNGEPIATIEGSSFAISLIEAEVIQLHRYIQIATLFELIRLKIKTEAPPIAFYGADDVERLERLFPSAALVSRGTEYLTQVKDRFALLKEAANGYGIIEAGLRSAPTSEWHIKACHEMRGLEHTSHMAAAERLHMKCSGTMGHEHVQRHKNDYAAFEAMLTRKAGTPICLVDTWSVAKGMGAVRELMDVYHPQRSIGVRFDSGHVTNQLAEHYESMQDVSHWILAGGMNPDLVGHAARRARRLGISSYKLSFLVGGYLVCPDDGMSRDDVGAVYKLCSSDGPTNKSSEGKVSIPGKPVLWRPTDILKGWICQPDDPETEGDEKVVNLFEDVRHISGHQIKNIITRDEVPNPYWTDSTKNLLTQS